MAQNFILNIQAELEKRKEKDLYRSLSLPSGIDFCSNDYLGLSKDIRIHQALHEGIEIYGAGSMASRLVRGHRDAYENLESSFARMVQGKDALFVANGFTANLGLLDSIADLQTIVFCDRLNHASILDGIRLSGAKRVYYNHLDMDDLRNKLNHHKERKKKIIVSETVFSMDGDVLPIKKFIELAMEFDCVTVLDETHAVGVFGEKGGGVSCDKGLLNPTQIDRIDFRIYTMGKALGLEGGLIVFNDSILKEYMINSMRGFIFSTAPLPAIAYAGLKSIEIINQDDGLREKVLLNARKFLELIQDLCFEGISSASQIVPVIFDSEKLALQAAENIRSQGLDVRAIRPPTVPTPRLRISIHADHEKADLDRLADALKGVHFKQG